VHINFHPSFQTEFIASAPEIMEKLSYFSLARSILSHIQWEMRSESAIQYRVLSRNERRELNK